MAKEQVLGFKSARRLEEVDNEYCERMEDREHRPRSCDDSSRRCDSQAGWNFRKGQVTDVRFGSAQNESSALSPLNYNLLTLVGVGWRVSSVP